MNTKPEGTKPQLDPTKIGPCESCGVDRQWHPQDGRFVLVALDAANKTSIIEGGPVLPVRALVCGNCANVRLFASEAYV
jgi:hypothetical protein